MTSKKAFCRFEFFFWLLLFTFCMPFLGSFALAQDIVQAGQVAGRPEVRPPQLMERLPERGAALEERLLRLLDLPAAQKALNFTEDQRKKLEDINFNLRRSLIQQEAALGVQRLELERLMRADTPDRTAIEKKVQEAAQAQTSLMRARINALLDLRGMLTKEQQDKIREFVRQRIQRGAQAGVRSAQPAPKVNPQAPGIPSAPPAPPKPPGL